MNRTIVGILLTVALWAVWSFAMHIVGMNEELADARETIRSYQAAEAQRELDASTQNCTTGAFRNRRYKYCWWEVRSGT